MGPASLKGWGKKERRRKKSSVSQLLTSDFANLEDKQGTQLAVSDGEEGEERERGGKY